ncbi:MAG: DNA methyltransferase [Sulfolobales archaeon]|nr:DNA methyltransferase [Sulfolobales archaeon]
MRELKKDEYLEYISRRSKVIIEGQEIPLDPIKVRRIVPEESELTDLTTTVWSFPTRGNWATHKGDYRGNWAPQIPRALIGMYTAPGDVVLDPMSGSGTTCIEARLLGRHCIAVDINYDASILTYHRLHWLEESVRNFKDMPEDISGVLSSWSKVFHGDARKLSLIEDSSVDLIATHPPYWKVIEYSSKCLEGDLSCANTLESYLELISEVAKELYRVLKPGKYLGILVGDTRIRKHYVPITHHVMNAFLKEGFILKEEVVKVQHKMKATREIWSRSRNRDFLLIYHEKLYIFRKPGEEKLSGYKYSMALK